MNIAPANTHNKSTNVSNPSDSYRYDYTFKPANFSLGSQYSSLSNSQDFLHYFGNRSFDLESEFSTLENSSSFSSSMSLSDSFPEISASASNSLFGAALITNLNSSITSNANQKSIDIAKMGNGPEGHAFDAVYHAELSASQSRFNTDIENATITLGSAFGPEGLVAGLAGAAIESVFLPSQIDSNTTMSTTGDLVSDANAQ